MKMPKKNLHGLLAIGALCLSVVTAARAADAGPTSGPSRAGMRGFITTLTAEQQAAIRKLVVEHEKQAIALRAELKTKELDLYTLVTGDAAQAKIDAALEEIGKVRVQLEKLRMGLELAIRKQLTAEQKAKFDAGFLRRVLHRGGQGLKNRPGPMQPGGGPEQ